MIAIDTLINNLLHRTGTVAQCRAEHAYGPACYAPRSCASIVRQLAHEGDLPLGGGKLDRANVAGRPSRADDTLDLARAQPS